MRDSGVLEQLSRGPYRLAELPPLASPDPATVALKGPQAVICLVSALAFHERTTQIPHVVDIALPNRAERPRRDYPPLRIFWFSGLAKLILNWRICALRGILYPQLACKPLCAPGLVNMPDTHAPSLYNVASFLPGSGNATLSSFIL
jgi:hypothetical protein